MDVFKEVTFTFDGVEYVLPAEQQLRAIAKIEDVLTLGELGRAQGGGRIPLAKLAIAYGIVLRECGAKLTDEQVYNGMFKDGGRELARRSLAAIVALQALMIPPEHLRAKNQGKTEAPEETATSASSGQPTGSS